ncbi:MFS transporter [Ornithinimicrobium ciconiae]|uniref:MFS transporter n=1 Tax=Ornithinimicrobium ciconiae TaxID=2594265 RepID=UPI001D18F6AF|nr:MFS transporter [Ornithinimicrobium ciconiae]
MTDPGGPSPVLETRDVVALQTRTVRTLMGSQVLGGVGVASGIAVAALMAADISGRDDLSGLANTTQVLGGALLTIPIAALMAARGRRVGLMAAYLIGTLGAGLAILAAELGSFPLLLLGTALFGASSTANSQARYAAVDLAVPARRGRQLSLVVWATTLGSVLGPNMLGPGKAMAESLGLPPLAGAWVFSAAGFVLAAVLVNVLLRPDPLLTARALALPPPAKGVAVDPAPTDAPADDALARTPRVGQRGSVVHGARAILASPTVLLGTVTVTIGHVVMVAVMVMTPIHMAHGHAEVEVIGFVISMHILGMYGLAPVAGYLTDRRGSRPVILGGVGILVLACLLAATSSTGWSAGLLAGLFLLGLGWSCTMVAGSHLIAAGAQVEDRASVQGASDLIMGLSAAAAGALAGVVVQHLGYDWLGAMGALTALALGGYTVVTGRRVTET